MISIALFTVHDLVARVSVHSSFRLRENEGRPLLPLDFSIGSIGRISYLRAREEKHEALSARPARCRTHKPN